MTGRHRALVLAASAPRFCPVCNGQPMRIRFLATPAAGPLSTPCPHCGPAHLPVAYLPKRNDNRDRKDRTR